MSQPPPSPLMLWLASIPCVSTACEPPETAPLTPEEADLVAERGFR
jgi:hypothetical protein